MVLPSLLLLCGNKNDSQCYQLTSNRFLCSLTNATKSKILLIKCEEFGTFLHKGHPGRECGTVVTPTPPHSDQSCSVRSKDVPAGLKHCFFGGKGGNMYSQKCFKEPY